MTETKQVKEPKCPSRLWVERSYRMHWKCARYCLGQIRYFKKQKFLGKMSLKRTEFLNDAKGAYKVHVGILMSMERTLGLRGRYGKTWNEAHNFEQRT